MYPVYRCMDSYPQTLSHQANHIPYPHYYPSWGFSPSQFKVDQDKPVIDFEPWSYGHIFNYPNSTDCNGCCKYSHPPGYYSFRQPHPCHLPPCPPVYSHGHYSPYSNAYPPYFVPPPYYPSEQPGHEYEKSMSKDHCCGCLNHACKRKHDTNVKIDEGSIEDEQKHKFPSSLVKNQNYPYPIVWIPPGYVKDKETSKPIELYPVKDKETSKHFEMDPKVWNGWLPFDLNGLRSLKQAEEDDRNQIQRDDKGNKNQMNEDKKTRLPYPIIWLPGFENPQEVEKKDLKEVNANPKVMEEPQPKFKIFPVKFLENENGGEKAEAAEEATGNGIQAAVEEKKTKPKMTPVKLLGIEEDTKPNSTTVKQLEASKESDSSRKESPSSPVKSSKLPPVCLRVEPLPKKKNGNGNSRSPSPPAAKERRQQDSKQQDSIQDKKKEDNKKEEQPKRKEIKVVEVQDEAKNQTEKERKAVDVVSKDISYHEKENTGKLDQAPPQVKVPEVSAADTSTDRVADEVKADQRQHGKEEWGELAAKAVGSKGEEQKKPKRELSSTDAAILSQSAYRGFEVRKWEPLKKLKQIARVREQANDVRGKLCALENSARLQQHEKQRIVMNETIMSLLLQLDTIQGLHPCVREIRKSVARELVCLQEKLDQLAVDKPAVGEESAEHRSSEGHNESTHDQKERTLQQEELVTPPTLSDMVSDQKPPEPQLPSDVLSDLKQEDVIEPHLDDIQQREIKLGEIVEGKVADVEAKKLVNQVPSVVDEMPCSGYQELVQMLPVKDQSSDTDADVSSESTTNGEADSGVSKLVQLPVAEQEIGGSAIDKLVEEPLPKKPEQPSNVEYKVPSVVDEMPCSGYQELVQMLPVKDQRSDTEADVSSESGTTNGEADSGVRKLVQLPVAEKEIGGSAMDKLVEEPLPKKPEEPSNVEYMDLPRTITVSETGIAEASEKLIGDLPSVQVEETIPKSMELPIKPSESGVVEDSEKQTGDLPSIQEEVTSISQVLPAAILESGIAETSEKVSGEQPSVEDLGAPRLELSSPQDEEADALSVVLPREEEKCAKVVEETESGVVEPTIERPNKPTLEKDELTKSELEELPVLSSPETGFCAVGSTCRTESNQSSESMIHAAQESDVVNSEGGENIKTMVESMVVLSSAESGDCELPPGEIKTSLDVPRDLLNEKEETKPGSEMKVETTDAPTEDKVRSVTVKKHDANEVQPPVPPIDSSFDVKLRKERDLVEENENLKMMLEKLIEAGKQQLTAMSDLNDRVRYLERRLSKKKKLKVNRRRAVDSVTK